MSWSSRRKWAASRAPRIPTAFLPEQKRIIFNNLNRLEARTIETLVDRPFTYEDVMAWLFPADVLKLCRDAVDKLHNLSPSASYEVTVNPDLTAHMFIHQRTFACPHENTLAVSPDAVPLMEAFAQSAEIFEKFNKIKTLMEWLNENATPGAVRYYAPSLLTLLPPDNTPLFEASGERYKEPKGLSEQLPTLRDAAATLAQALLLPEVKAERDTGITYWLNIGYSSITETWPLV